ncbi:hypothetical protein AX15_006092, partial [Amanita polypyramis BW_CC]
GGGGPGRRVSHPCVILECHLMYCMIAPTSHSFNPRLFPLRGVANRYSESDQFVDKDGDPTMISLGVPYVVEISKIDTRKVLRTSSISNGGLEKLKIDIGETNINTARAKIQGLEAQGMDHSATPEHHGGTLIVADHSTSAADHNAVASGSGSRSRNRGRRGRPGGRSRGPSTRGDNRYRPY